MFMLETQVDYLHPGFILVMYLCTDIGKMQMTEEMKNQRLLFEKHNKLTSIFNKMKDNKNCYISVNLSV